MLDPTPKTTVLKTSDLNGKDALRILGLNEEFFQEIGNRILSAYSQTTIHDAANASGSYAYLAAVRAIRDILCPKGWESFSKDHLEFTSLPKKKIKILVSSGDKYTGNKKFDPSTKNPKGSQTKKIVSQNSWQLYLFPEMMTSIQKKPDSEHTWFFLYHLDIKNTELRMELSLPINFNGDDRVCEWKERIILPKIDFNSSTIAVEPELIQEIEFEIKRKSNG